MAPRWIQPAVWTVAGAALVWAVIGHCLIWLTHLTDEGGQLDQLMNEDWALEIGKVDPEEAAERNFLNGQTYTAYVNGSLDITPEPTHWNSYWRHHYSPELAHEKETMLIMQNPNLYDLRAPGQLVAMYLVYFLPMFVVGLCGWITQNWPGGDHQLWEWNARIRAAFNRQVPPVAFWKNRINGLSFSELGVILLFFIPKLSHLVWFLNMSRNEWLGGVEASYAVKFPTETQYWLERIGLWLAVDFEIQAPFLFAFAARGSLVNSYLGVAFGTIIKWHRWMGIWTMTNIFTHGILYQVLLRSESAATWAVFYTRMHYLHGASSLGGRLSWISMIIMGLCVIPLVRRYYYKVFYRVHVVGAIFFVCFGIVHSRKVFVFFGPGLVLYGIDLAYRWLQASYDVILHVNPGSKLVSIVIPLEEGVKYADGSHVWVAIPQLGKLEYHPFCVASTSADPAWQSSILLYCKSFNRWTEKLLEGASTGKLHKIRARVQGPFGGHTLPVAEMDAPQHMIVFVGGVGAPTVLSILKRLAIHRDANRRLLAGHPKVKVFHTARTLDEVILLAPLLDHPNVFDISLHYTGKTPLTTCTLIMPSPVPLDGETPCGHFACDTETLLHLQDAPNLKVYNGDASASIANSKALSKAFSERLIMPSVTTTTPRNSGKKSFSMKSKKQNKFVGKEVGGFKKVNLTFAPDPDPRLVGLRGKWETLAVWVGSWCIAFWSLMLGELWHNASLDHQAGLVNDQSRNHRRYRMAILNIIGAFLMVPLVPLSLIILCRAVRDLVQYIRSALPSPRVEVHDAPNTDENPKESSKCNLPDAHSFKNGDAHVWEEERASYSVSVTGGLEHTIAETTEETEIPRGYINSVFETEPMHAKKDGGAPIRQGPSGGLIKGQNPRRHFNAPLAHQAHALSQSGSHGISDATSVYAEPSHTYTLSHTGDSSRGMAASVAGQPLENVPEGEEPSPNLYRWPPKAPGGPISIQERVSSSQSTHARQKAAKDSAAGATDVQSQPRTRETSQVSNNTDVDDDFGYGLTSRARAHSSREIDKQQMVSRPREGHAGVGRKSADGAKAGKDRKSSHATSTHSTSEHSSTNGRRRSYSQSHKSSSSSHYLSAEEPSSAISGASIQCNAGNSTQCEPEEPPRHRSSSSNGCARRGDKDVSVRGSGLDNKNQTPIISSKTPGPRSSSSSSKEPPRRSRRSAGAVAEGRARSTSQPRHHGGIDEDSDACEPSLMSGALTPRRPPSASMRPSTDHGSCEPISTRKASILSFAEYARSSRSAERQGASDSSSETRRNPLFDVNEVPDLSPARANLRDGTPSVSTRDFSRSSGDVTSGDTQDGGESRSPVNSLSKWGHLPRLRSLQALVATGSRGDSRGMSRENSRERSTSHTPRSHSTPRNDRSQSMYSQRSEATETTQPSTTSGRRSGSKARMHERTSHPHSNSQIRSPSPTPSSSTPGYMKSPQSSNATISPRTTAKIMQSLDTSGNKAPTAAPELSRSSAATYMPANSISHSSGRQTSEIRTGSSTTRSHSPATASVPTPASLNRAESSAQRSPRKSRMGITITHEQDSQKIGRECKRAGSFRNASAANSSKLGVGGSTGGDAADVATHASGLSRSGFSGLSGRLWRQVSIRDGRSHSLMGVGRNDTCEIDHPGSTGALFGQDVDNIVLVDAEDPKKATIMTGRRGAVPQPIKSGRPDVEAEINTCFEASMKTGYTLSVWSAGPGVLNEAVHMAAHALPLKADVRVFPMAYEL